MPELPEVETVRRTLARSILGRRADSVEIGQHNVVHAGRLQPDRFVAIERRGKQLALIGEKSCACVHLGMTGSLRYRAKRDAEDEKHTHVTWRLDRGARLTFRDPRRFGGIWAFTSLDELIQQRWSGLGEDALTIKPLRLHRHLSRTSRPIKAALLDQQVIAGLGNIYVDELLFARRIHPLTPASRLDRPQTVQLVKAIRRLLNRAIAAGGSTLRDYQDANGQPGVFRDHHRVYSQAGKPCPRCEATLKRIVIIGRSTTLCDVCQPLSEEYE